MSSRDLLDLIWIVPALPLFGAIVLLLFGKRIGEPFAGWIATTLVGLSFIASLVMFFAMLDLPSEVRVNIVTLYTWLPAGALHVDMGFYADTLSVTWILLITGVGSLIHLYSIGYMHGDERFSRFFAYLNLFVFSMLMLVLGSSFLVTFLGWEGVGLCSYLLVSFWFERNAAAVAGKKAFVTNRVGDVGFLLAMFLIFASYGSLNYAAIPAGAHGIASGTATAIALLLLVAAIGKSAQIPLHLWLPDAMEGPTPVSALIHAATMVTAGVFLLCRAHVFLDVSRDAGTVVAWVGGITALLAGTVAILQPDIKRVLAYSTVSQLGYMFLAIGIHAYTAAVFMVLCHAFYKGCLFLGAGSVIHGNHDVQDMRVMGRFRKFMPYTAGADGGRVARHRRRAAAVGLLLQGRDHQPGVPARRVRPVGRRHHRRRLHRGLHDPPHLAHVLRQRALRDRRARGTPSSRSCRAVRARTSRAPSPLPPASSTRTPTTTPTATPRPPCRTAIRWPRRWVTRRTSRRRS